MYENLKDHALSFINGVCGKTSAPDTQSNMRMINLSLTPLGQNAGMIAGFLIIWLFAPQLIAAVALFGMITITSCLLMSLVPALPQPKEEKITAYILGAAFPFICMALMGIIWALGELL